MIEAIKGTDKNILNDYTIKNTLKPLKSNKIETFNSVEDINESHLNKSNCILIEGFGLVSTRILREFD
jgi:hypothetical protein